MTAERCRSLPGGCYWTHRPPVPPESIPPLDDPRDAPSHLDVDTSRADMRIEVVKQELNRGALAGYDSSVTDYAARLVVAALDTFDEDAERRAYAAGFRQGVAFHRTRAAPDWT